MAERSGRKAVESLLYSTDRVRILDMVTKMGEMASQALGMAVRSLVDRDDDLAWSVIEGDDAIDRMEEFIDQECLGSIAMRRPGDAELRFVFAALKIITDLERIGDEAKKIAKTAKQLHSNGSPFMPQIRLGHIADAVVDMLRTALDAYARLDTVAAAQVVRHDKEVDAEFKGIMRQLITYMMEDPRTISNSLEMLFIAKSIERIGDHAMNIAEHVVYVAHGQDVRFEKSQAAALGDKR